MIGFDASLLYHRDLCCLRNILVGVLNAFRRAFTRL